MKIITSFNLDPTKGVYFEMNASISSFLWQGNQYLAKKPKSIHHSELRISSNIFFSNTNASSTEMKLSPGLGNFAQWDISEVIELGFWDGFSVGESIQCETRDTGWVGEGKLENGSSGSQELSLDLQLLQAGLYFSPKKYSGIYSGISKL